ncbi:hypothetical protein BGZ63DRAFT_372178 [Mariannaea sp. PMI_226]|nr:hypothetical protein BGZ63DRAFT_372178 [Mariannaea sp. PMI_226]
MPDNQLITYAPNTFIYHFSTVLLSSITNSYTIKCHLDLAKDTADCNAVIHQTVPGKTTTTRSMETDYAGFTSTPVYVTVTAGAEKLKGEENSATTSKETGAPKTAAAATTSSTATALFSTAKSSNPAAPAATQHGLVAGIAAVVGGAAMIL